MTRQFDTVVVGGDVHGLVAAIRRARAGSRVLLVEESGGLGGAWREIAFAKGFRAAPLAPDLGYVSADVLREVADAPLPEVASDPTVVSLTGGEPLVLRPSVQQTAEGLRHFSAADAKRWPEFTRRLYAFSEFLREIYRAPPPRIDADTFGEYAHLAKLGWRFHQLGKTDSIELLHMLPIAIADLLDDYFESNELKGLIAGLAVTDLCQGPMATGTAFSLLHRHVGARSGTVGERLRLKQGAGSLVRALETRARALGVAIETGQAVRRIVVKEGQVAGVSLASGEEIECTSAISCLDPYRSLLELLDPVNLDPDFILSVRNIRFRGVTTRVLVALDELPPVANLGAPSGTIVIAPSMRYLERAYDAAKYGRCSDEPYVEVRFPSLVEPGLAPERRHVAVLHVQYTPYRLREASWNTMRETIADRAVALVDLHMPGFAARVSERMVLAPPDIEARFGLREGAVSQGEVMLDQVLFMRPVPGAARGETPIAGYSLYGPATHPGPGIVT